MSCEEACGVAALAASGDATLAELHALEMHTAACAACQAEVAGFEALRDQLHAMRETELSDSAYAAVRARVVSQLDGRRRWRWVVAWSSLAALAAAACCMVATFALHRASPVAAVGSPAAAVEIASVQDNELHIPPPRAPHRFRKVVRRTVPQEQETPIVEPIVVHMFTSDPNVVIYWVADARVKSSNKETVQ